MTVSTSYHQYFSLSLPLLYHESWNYFTWKKTAKTYYSWLKKGLFGLPLELLTGKLLLPVTKAKHCSELSMLTTQWPVPRTGLNFWLSPSAKDLVTVFDAILTSRQTREKLQCLYENLTSNNFRKTAVLKKNIWIVNSIISYTAKDFTDKFSGQLLCLNFSRRLL